MVNFVRLIVYIPIKIQFLEFSEKYMEFESWLLHCIDNIPNNLAIDIGANIGLWTELLSKKFNSVIAIEPDIRAYKILSTKLPANATAIHGAVCNVGEDINVNLYLRSSTEQSSILETHPIGGPHMTDVTVSDVVQVKSYTINELSSDGADFVKIDTEGSEVSILSVADFVIWKRTTFLVECHNTFEEVYKQLSRLNKDIVRIMHPSIGAHQGHCWAIGKPKS